RPAGDGPPAAPSKHHQLHEAQASTEGSETRTAGPKSGPRNRCPSAENVAGSPEDSKRWTGRSDPSARSHFDERMSYTSLAVSSAEEISSTSGHMTWRMVTRSSGYFVQPRMSVSTP